MENHLLPFARFYCVRDDYEKAIFAQQIREFIVFVWKRVGQDYRLKYALQEAQRVFHLRCHQFDYVKQQLDFDYLTNDQAIVEIRNACRALWLIMRPDYRKAAIRLSYWHRFYTNYKGYGQNARKQGVQRFEDWTRRLSVAWSEENCYHPFDDLWWIKTGDPKTCLVVRYDAMKIHSVLQVNDSEEIDSLGGGDSVRLTTSQQAILERLNAFWKMKRDGSRVAGVNSRPIPLIIAPSGTGKSFLVRHFARVNNLPILALDSSAWIVSGANTTPHTVNLIHQFTRNHETGVLMIDELDKFYADSISDWSRSVLGEVMSLLDGGLRGFEVFSDEEKRKLQNSFFMVGCATFQSLYKAGGKNMGFQQGSANFSIEHEVVKSAGIPHELLARFNCNLLVMTPPKVEEFADWIEAIHDALQIESSVSVEKLSEEAFSSGLCTRWLEAYVSKLLLAEKQPLDIEF